ncbi:hypothetical protein OJ998_22770 [Solirubrobacter taibaiensis]|nr:hypothetical protein [Solirubrobacter taibaiensis]
MTVLFVEMCTDRTTAGPAPAQLVRDVGVTVGLRTPVTAGSTRRSPASPARQVEQAE